MHQVSLETICPLKAFQLRYCPDNDAKSIVKHFIFLHKFTVISNQRFLASTLLSKINLGKWPSKMRSILAIRPSWIARLRRVSNHCHRSVRVSGMDRDSAEAGIDLDTGQGQNRHPSELHRLARSWSPGWSVDSHLVQEQSEVQMRAREKVAHTRSLQVGDGDKA